MKTVILRIVETRNGYIHKMWNFPVPFERAEKLCGHTLDRRKSYAIIDGIVSELISWVDTCSGCTESNEGVVLGAMGCGECGYTGKRRRGQYVPIDSMSQKYWERENSRHPVFA